MAHLLTLPKQAGLANAGDGNFGMGVAVGDYDNDGYPDLYVTSYGKNTLYHNNGDGTFTDVTEKAGVAAAAGQLFRRIFRLRQRRQPRPVRHALYAIGITKQQDLRRRVAHLLPARRISGPTTTYPLSQSRRRHVRRRQRDPASPLSKGARSASRFADYDGDGFTDIFVANDVMRQFCSTTMATALSASALRKPARRSHWRWR